MRTGAVSQPVPDTHSDPEQTFPYAAGTTTLKLTIDEPGVVDIERHEPEALVLQLEVMEVSASRLQELGIGVEIRTVEFQTLLQQHKARNYQAVISNWTLDNFKVDPTPLFTCEEAQKPGSANRAGFCDPQMDALVERGLRTTDPAEATRTWAEFTDRLQEQQPITFLFWSEDLAGVGQRVQEMETDVRSKIANIDRWWIPESRRR